VDPEERVLEKPFALEDLTAAIVGVLSRGPGPSSGGPGKRP